MRINLFTLMTVSLCCLAVGCDSELFPDLNPDSNSSSVKYVDLGLSVKWATCNLGATKPEEAGLYYQWGDTKGYGSDTSDGKNFYLNDENGNTTYKWCSNEKHPYLKRNKLTKYNTDSDSGPLDNKTVLDPEDDTAHVALGGKWRMPTDAEWTELKNNCTWTWTTVNGIRGYRVTSKKSGYTDKSIFLPAANYRSYGRLDKGYYGPHGNYWSSSLYTGNPIDAYEMTFNEGDVHGSKSCRGFGLSVRPVSE